MVVKKAFIEAISGFADNPKTENDFEQYGCGV